MSHRVAPAHGVNLQHRQHHQRSQRRSLTAVYALLCTSLLPTTVAGASSNATRSTKRGLINIETLTTAQQDDAVIIGGSSDLTWYYNYGSEATDYLADSGLEYVPQCWGSPGTTFLTNVTSQLSAGLNITHVLGFNEPDGCTGGGACIPATDAATYWIDQIEPLKTKHGLKLGSPAPTGSQQGLQWMREWFTACDGGCNPDFIALHWYGSFEGLASWIGQINASYISNITEGIWITEFALEDATLDETQVFYNQSTDYLDDLSYIGRYAWFGSFRSDVSNVGVNVAMLDGYGDLTDIGSWYKGDSATGVVPTSSGNSSTTGSSGSGNTSTSAAVTVVAPGVLLSLMMLGLLVALRMV